MSDHDLQTDEEVLTLATREELLTSGALGTTRAIRGLTLRASTMESMSYLWELKNYFVYRDEQGRVARNNPVIGVAEFVYVHHADIDEVAETITDKTKLRLALRELMNGPLAGFKTMTEAMPVIEEMLTEYAAAQTEIDSTAKGASPQVGKGRARHGKQRISR